MKRIGALKHLKMEKEVTDEAYRCPKTPGNGKRGHQYKQKGQSLRNRPFVIIHKYS
jgi:hypothetical protein